MKILPHKVKKLPFTVHFFLYVINVFDDIDFFHLKDLKETNELIQDPFYIFELILNFNRKSLVVYVFTVHISFVVVDVNFTSVDEFYFVFGFC